MILSRPQITRVQKFMSAISRHEGLIHLRPAEIAVAVPFGLQRGTKPLAPAATIAPKAAFEGVLRTALQKQPCVIGFSGGRDSSAVLATAVQVARTEGLPLPVPATLVFPNSPESHEDDWQSLVLQHLGITERLVYSLTSELDALGDDSQRLLRKVGLTFPYNLHFHDRIAQDARGGSFLTGFGGDELAASGASRWAERAINRRKFGKQQALAVGYQTSPRVIKYLADLARSDIDNEFAPWLTRKGRAMVAHMAADDSASIPFGWQHVLRNWMWRSRYFLIAKQSFSRMCALYGVTAYHPFIESEVLNAFAAFAPFEGLFGRKVILELLVGDLLPTAVVGRQSKADFTDCLWAGGARDFAANWDGLGVDTSLVDPELLRQEWLSPIPSGRSLTLLQQAWMYGAGVPAHGEAALDSSDSGG